MSPQEGAQLQETETTETMESSVLSQTIYAFDRKTLNETLKRMRDCGTEGVLHLPKIAVIGNQSAGKSSLLEAISQIILPRASGTCTRCPMEVVLSSDSVPWKCRVSLRFERCGLVHFTETMDRDQVSLILRRAQLAILNQQKDLKDFLEMDEKTCDAEFVSIPFSRDTVVVEISGADVDVTFIDLPGIISNTERVCQTWICTEM